MNLTMLQGDVFEQLKGIESESIDLAITSPPYWGLRNYGNNAQVIGGEKGCKHEWINGMFKNQGGTRGENAQKGGTQSGADAHFKTTYGTCQFCGAWYGQLGNEPTMELYLENMMRWVKEIYRVLKPTGSFVLNIGDCFTGSGKGGTSISGINPNHRESQPHNFKWCNSGIYKSKQLLSVSSFAYCKIISETDFVCRGEHIWAKPNVPSPIRSRLKHSHEKLFWFVKDAEKYYFNSKSWMKKIKEISNKRYENANSDSPHSDNIGLSPSSCFRAGKGHEYLKNKDTIEHSWRIIPVGEKQNGFELSGKGKSEHIAPFPSALIRPYITSMCPPGGIVLDPFLGSGTTMRVAMEEGRNCIGIELNEKYIAYAKKRVNWGGGLDIEYEEALAKKAEMK